MFRGFFSQSQLHVSWTTANIWSCHPVKEFNLSSLSIRFINVDLCIVSISFQRGLELLVVAFFISLTFFFIFRVQFFFSKLLTEDSFLLEMLSFNLFLCVVRTSNHYDISENRWSVQPAVRWRTPKSSNYNIDGAGHRRAAPQSSQDRCQRNDNAWKRSAS